MQVPISNRVPTRVIRCVHPHFKRFDLRSNFIDNTDALVAENHVLGLVMQVGSTETGMRDPYKDLVWLKDLFVRLGFDNFSAA